MADLWRDFWIRETGTGQQVAQLHDRYMMMTYLYREKSKGNVPVLAMKVNGEVKGQLRYFLIS